MALLNNPQGQVVNVPVTPGMELEFGFDPGSEAQLERDGDSLIFKFDDGGQIVLTDFYAQEIEQLPTMDIQGAQISAEDFLASLGDETLLPAAGPAAQAPAAAADGSGGQYDANAGDFIGGIDRLGMLGRIFWAQPAGRPLTDEGLEFPGGTPGVDPLTDLGDGVFTGGAYEDAMPFQNVGDYSFHPAQLHFNFSPTGTTEVTDIAMSGFDVGTKLYIGVPGQPGTVEIEITSLDQVVHFTHLNFTQNGVYFVPPVNSDHDMNIHAEVTITTASGLTDVIPINFVITVDAVADLPVNVSTDVTSITDFQGQDSTEVKTVSVYAGATYSDVLDGTEHHYIEMRGIPSDWTIKNIPAGWVLVDANGNPISFDQVARGEHGTYELRFDVTGAATADAKAHGTLTGNVGGNVVFDPHDWSSSGATDANGNAQKDVGRWSDGTENHSGPAEIEVRATAIEKPTDGELDLNNNTAESAWTKTDPINVVEDTPDISADTYLSLDETRGAQGDEVSSLTSLDAKIAGAVTSAIAGYQGNGELLGASTQEGITFNLHSDGYGDSDKATRDSAGNPIAKSSQIALSWDLTNLPDLSAKLPEHDQYYELQYRQTGPDANGQYTLVGYYVVGGQEYVALVGVLTPNFADGTAKVTFAQYAAFEHASGLDRNPLDTNFGIKITDDEGDVAKTTVPLTIMDDVPDAGDSQAAVFDEKDDSMAISGNVLDKTVNDHDDSNDSAQYDQAYSGSDGWVKGGGVVGYEIELDPGYTIQGNPTAPLVPGQNYVILDADGNAQGAFTLDGKGNWSFSKDPAAGQDVIKDFEFKVTYTVQDADGDTAKADLSIDVKAAPLMAGIEVITPEVYESAHTVPGNISVDDAAGVARYTIQAYNYDGTKAQGAALYEPMLITLQLKFPANGAASLDDFDFDKLMAMNPGVVTGYNDKTGEIYIKITSTDPGGQVELKLPLWDDSIGGKGTSSDGPVENYSLEITDIHGATPDHYVDPTDQHYADKGIDTAQDTSIIDDGTFYNDKTGKYEYLDNDLDAGYSHANDPHPLDGPMIGLNVPATITEGGTKTPDTAQIRLDGTDPNTGKAYVAGVESDEQMVLTMKFTLTGGADASDVAVTPVAFAGVTYYYSTDSGTTWTAFSGNLPASALDNGGVKFKVEIGSGFDLSNLSKIGFNVQAVNDNKTESGEGFKISIETASGNECSYHGNEKATSIVDNPVNTLAISGNPEVWEGGTLAFTLTLKTDAILNSTNTDKVTITLELGGTATYGADYNLADIIKANPHLTNIQYLGNGKISFEVDPSKWSNQGNAGNHTIKFNVLTTHDNQIGELDETVTVKIADAKGAEIVSTSGEGKGVIEDRAALSLTAEDGSAKTPDIYEDKAMADAFGGKTVATYNVNWLHDDGLGKGALHGLIPTGAGDKAASNFTFDVTLKDGAGANGAKFDANMLDNVADNVAGHEKYGTDAVIGDYGWAVLNPDTGNVEIVQYGDLNTKAGQDTLLDAINKYLKAAYGTNAKGEQLVEATAVTMGGRSVTFTVREGADLSHPMKIYVGAIDDRITENRETFEVQVSNIKAEDKGKGQNVIIDDKNKASTDILDDHGRASQDGFLVALDNNRGIESDKFIKLPVLLFERGPDGNPINANPHNPPSQAIKITLQAGDKLDTATLNADYYTTTADGKIIITIPAGEANWVFVPAANGIPAHWEAKDVKIPLNDDRLTEGEETFTVVLEDVEGHESSILPTGKLPGIDNDAKLTIEDDYKIPTTDQDKLDNQPDRYTNDPKDYQLDGPDLAGFGPMSPVVEPVAPYLDGAASDGSQINADAAVNTVAWQVSMTADVAQDTIVFIKFADTSWKDFKPSMFGDGRNGTLGRVGSPADHANGVYTLAELKAMFPAYDIDPNGGQYFVIIPKGSASTTFNIDILHDHDDTGDKVGVDQGTDHVDMTITNIQGSETVFDKQDPPAAAHSKEPILDDNLGPIVSMSVANGVIGGTMDMVFEMTATCTEPVKVTVMITLADGSQYPIDVTIPAGSKTYTHTIQTPNSDYIYTQVKDTKGGESQVDPATKFADIGGGSGTGPDTRIVLGIDADNIKEQGETSVTYTVTGDIPPHHPSADLDFTIKVINNTTEDGDFKNGGPGEDIHVHIPKELLDQCNGKFTLEIKDGPNGPEAVLKDASGNIVDQSAHPITILDDDGNAAKLPQALDDKFIEGDEGFSSVITDIKGGGTVDPDKAIAESKIEDNDIAEAHVVFCDKDGNILTPDQLHAQEGHDDIYVKVVLTVVGGDPTKDADRLELGNGSATFKLTPGGNATAGTDFVMDKSSLTVPGGKSESAPMKIKLPDDFQSEDPEKLNFKAEASDAISKAHYPDGFVQPKDSQTMTIDDYINGPKILAVTPSTTSINEGQSVSYALTLDKALEQKATLTFKVDLYQGDTKDGFTKEDIESVTVNGKTWTIAQILNGDAGLNAYIGPDGNLYVKMDMASGLSKESFSIKTFNDVISEGKESIKVSLIETEGGELNTGKLTDPNDPKSDYQEVGPGNEIAAKDVIVNEVSDGPAISLAKVDAEGIEGESINIAINLNGGKDNGATISPTTIVLKVDPATIDATGTIKVTGPGGYETTGTLNNDGTVTIILPAGVKGPLNVEFPLKDNAVSGDSNKPFSASIDHIDGGEATQADAVDYSSKFNTETNNSLTFTLTGAAVSAAADLTISIDNMPSAGSVTQLVFTVNGVTYTVDVAAETCKAGAGAPYSIAGSLSYAGGKLTCNLVDANGDPIKVSGGVNGVPVKVVLDTSNAAQLAEAKLNITVAGELSGMELTLPIKDDPSDWDGPVFSVDGGADVAEGGHAMFTIHPNAQPGFGTAEENITLSFKVSGANFDSAGTVTVTINGVNYNATLAGGVYSITVPKGTNLTADMTVSVPTKADSVMGTDSTVTLELTKVTGGEATIDPAGKTAGTDVVEGSSADLLVASTGLEVTEGGSLSFNLHLQNASSQAAMSASHALTLTFMVAAADIAMFLDSATATSLLDGSLSGYTAGGLTWTYDSGHGGYLVSGDATFGNNGDASLNIPTLNGSDGMIGADHNPTLLLVDVDSHGLDVHLTHNGNDVDFTNPMDFQATVHDADTAAASAHADYTGTGVDTHGMELVDLSALTGDDTHDFSSSTHGVFAVGGAGDEHIIGSDYNDVIFGGSGNDTMTGGLGDDIFGWKAGDVGAPGHSALDTITDFSMKSGLIDGGSGNDMLDLRDLITVGSNESLDDYMNFKQDGDNAVLEVKNAAGGAGEVVQTIVLENVYSSHSIDTNDQDSMNELIKQHIMVNHS